MIASRSRRVWPAAVAAVASLLFGGPAGGRAADDPQAQGAPMSYQQAKDFLAKHTKVIELRDAGGARVAVCPAWQGRVMTSTCGGPEGPSFGFVNREFIEAGKPNPQFNNYGAEERLWLSPEGGQFSLWFKPGAQQKLDNWFTAPALNEGEFQAAAATADRVEMKRTMQFQNASATSFDLAVTRSVSLLDAACLANLLGKATADALAAPGVKAVAYQTTNTITNQGPPMTKEKGLVSMWILGMFNASPKTVVILPYKPGPEEELGPVVKSDYFGPVPPERLKITPEAILFSGDANCRSKLGTSQKRARNVLGSIDFQNNVLTLVQFTMPDDPAKKDYMNNMWELPQKQPYVGDVANTYNDGPPAPGKKGLGAFYEIESLSPAAALQTGQSLTHSHRTIHIQAELPVLAEIARATLGVDLAKVREAMVKD